MPSSMIHLCAAILLDSERDSLYWLGSLAPDGTKDIREIKDKTHFRDLTPEGRVKALRELADNTDLKDNYAEGSLLHLFLDNRWDAEAFVPYKQAHQQEEDWFVHYRREIMSASFHLYHTTDWSKKVWLDMLDIPLDKYGVTKSATPEDVHRFVEYNYIRHDKSSAEPSPIYTPEFVSGFIERAVKAYKNWR